MATVNVTTTVNYDDPSINTLGNGDRININGGALTIDSDVRWNQQEAVFGDIVMSSSLGGELLVDGTKIWEIPFSSSTGNVPTQLDLGSNGVTGGTSGAVGELTRVWETGSLTPSTAGTSMPSTGFIKLRSKTGDFQAGETITLPGGATITASSAGKRSWINVVGKGGLTGNTGETLTAYRLNIVEFEGDWYELGTTNGADDQTFQFPVIDVCTAIWIETAPSSGVYEIWLNADAQWTTNSISTNDKRGMYFGYDESTGVITLAARTGNTAGLKPVSGCKVRIPNIILSQADGITPDYDTNIKPTTGLGRYNLSTTSASLKMQNVANNWYMVFRAYAINFQNSAFMNPFQIIQVSEVANVTNCAVATIANSAAVHPLTFNSGIGVFTDCVFCRGEKATLRAINVTNTDRITFTRCRGSGTIPANSAVISLSGVNCTLTDCDTFGGPGLIDNSTGARITNFTGCLPAIGTTGASNWTWVMINLQGTDCLFDGFSWFDDLSDVGPTNYVFSISGRGNEVRNVGTQTNPLPLGTIYPPTNAMYGTPTGLTLRRLYFSGAVTRLAQFAGKSGVDSYNVWGDNGKLYEVFASDSISRGGRFTQGLNTGQYSNIYGQHWNDAWTSSTTGQITILCTEPTEQSASQCEFTLDLSSFSGFTSVCGVSMNVLTDEVIWTMPYFAIGITGFANSAPLLTGTNTGNINLDFQYDIGSGFNGSWLSLTGANLSGITVTPETGVRLKVRATLATAANSVLNFVRIATTATEESQRLQYPLPTTLNTATVLNIEPGSRIRVFNVTTDTEVANEIVSGSSWIYAYEEGTDFTDGDIINVRLTQSSGTVASLGYETTAVASSVGWTSLADQVDDEVYNAIGIDGSTITNFTADYINNEVDIGVASNFTGADFYAWWVYNLTTANGIANFFGGVTAQNQANFLINNSVVDIFFDNTTSTNIRQTDNRRIYRADEAYPVKQPGTGTGGIDIKWLGEVFIAETGVSGLTPTESAALDDILVYSRDASSNTQT